MKKRSSIFDTSMVYFIMLACFVLVRIGAQFNVLSFLGEATGYVYSFVIQVVIMFGMSIVLFTNVRKQGYKKTFKDFGFKKINLNAIIISILLGIVIYILNLAVATVFSYILALLGYNPSTSSAITSFPLWQFLLSLLFSCVLPGICEETAHRGMLLSGYSKLGMKKAIILSALFFGLMHLNIEQCFYATIIGAVFGFITFTTGSIIPAMIMHFLNNAIGTYISFASVNKLPFGNIVKIIQGFIMNNFFVALIVIFIVLTLLVLLGLYLMYLLFKETRIKTFTNLTEDLAKKELRNQIMSGVNGYQPEADSESIPFEKEVLVDEERTSIKIKIPINESRLITKQSYKPSFFDKIFIYSILFLSIAVTISTFIWGVL